MNTSIVIPANVTAYYGNRPLPRGIRNNNPGNVRLGSNWQGMSPIQTDNDFCQFSFVQHGLRALAYLMRTVYFGRNGLDTVHGIIHRWAPTSENDTDAYIAQVCKALRVDEKERLALRNDDVLGDLMQAIIKHENGAQPYTGLQIVSGIRLL